MIPVTKPLPPAALVEAVERALAPYKARFSAETVDRMRREALVQLAAHPYPAALARALRAPPILQESAVVGPEAEPAPSTDHRKGAA
jgi:hypothetical protein